MGAVANQSTPEQASLLRAEVFVEVAKSLTRSVEMVNGKMSFTGNHAGP